MVHGTCMVPTRIASYASGASSSCFRGHGQEALEYHTWWTCPKVVLDQGAVYNFIHPQT